MTAYHRLVAKHRRAIARREALAGIPIPPGRGPGGDLAALATVERLARDPVFIATVGGTQTTLYGPAAERHARELAARTLAAIDLAGVTPCPHLTDDARWRERRPGGDPPIVVLSHRRIVCVACLPALAASPPDPADADRCDWCGERGVTRFVPLIYPLGPSVVAGSACPACHAALAPGRDARPRGWG